MQDVRIVVAERRANTYGVNAVLGALDAESPSGAWSVAFATGPAQVAAEVSAGLESARRVLVAWSFYSPDAGSVFEDVVAVRARVDDLAVTHLAGGAHASAEPERTLRAGFDLVAVGEGEATLAALVGALAAGGDLASVAGLAYLDATGRFATTGGAARHELDRYPSFATRWGRFGPIEITRGCIYACRFCQTPYLFKARFRHRSVDSIRAHAAELAARGLRYARFITPTALSYGASGEDPDLAAVEEMLAAARAELGAGGKVYFGSFPSEVRPEHVTPAAMRVLRRHVDNTGLVIGAQSGSGQVLAAAKRGHGVEEVEAAVRIAAEHGFRPDVDFLFGLPGEAPEDVRASLALAERLAERGARIHAHTFMPLPGTPWRNAEPGTVAAPTRLALDRLAARGRLYGQWARQEQVAAELVPLVRRGRRAGAGDA